MRALRCLPFALAALTAAAGCYDPGITDGQFSCGSDSRCPAGFLCNDCGRCVKPNSTSCTSSGPDLTATVDGNGSGVDGGAKDALPGADMTPPAGCANGRLPVSHGERIAFCDGAWAQAGFTSGSTPCNHMPGNDGTANKVDCSAEDNCAVGWHLCMDEADVISHGLTKCPAFDGAFYATAETADIQACGGGHLIAGCGNLWSTTNGCSPIAQSLDTSSCPTGKPEWQCTPLMTSTVTKTNLPKGGVICCKN